MTSFVVCFVRERERNYCAIVLDNVLIKEKPMKRHLWISIVLFITFFSSSIFARRSHRDEEYIDLIDENLSSRFINDNQQDYHVDPNDRVDVDRWNQLNDADIKHMPSIDDYSSEINAIRWLKWRSRVALRYHQVYFIERQFVGIFFSSILD